MTTAWFAGCWQPEEAPAIVAPTGASSVFDGERRLWASGPHRVVATGGWRVAIFGLCAAPDGDVQRVLAQVAERRQSLEALTGLGGSYHAVVDNGYTITVIGDLAGTRQIFTAMIGGVRYFASSPRPLAAMLNARLDTAWLAATLFCADVVELHEKSSAFAGVARVPAGWLLRCGRSGATSIRRSDPAPDGRSLAEAARVLADTLQAAVAARVQEPISADLSGGLDSTSLALLAARRGPVLALTYADPLASGDEDVVFAQKAATFLPAVSHELISGDQRTLPYASLGETNPLMLDEPSQDLLIAARTRARLAPAIGGGTHLVGDGGDVVLAGPLTYLADLARNHRFRDLARESSAWARLRRRPATAVMRAALRCAATSYDASVRACAKHLETAASNRTQLWSRPGLESNLAWCRTSPACGWATATAARDLTQRLHALAETPMPAPTADAMALRAVRRHGDLTRSTQQLAASWSVPLHAPFLDDPVVSACAAVAVTDRTTAYAAKPLLQQALAGIVPHEILARRSKGDYTASEYAGLRAAAPHLRALLKNDPLLADLGLIEPSRVLDVLQDAVDGRAVPLNALGDVIATELWLRAIDRAEHPRPDAPGS